MWLEKLGLTKADDPRGVIETACKAFAGICLYNDEIPEDMEEFESVKILIAENKRLEPEHIAAHLLGAFLVGTDPDLVGDQYGPRVAQIIIGMCEVADDADFEAAIKNADPVVRQTYIALQINTLESLMKKHGEKPLSEMIEEEDGFDDDGEPVTVRRAFGVLLGVAYETGKLLDAALTDKTDEPGLEKRLKKALLPAQIKLASETLLPLEKTPSNNAAKAPPPADKQQPAAKKYSVN